MGVSPSFPKGSVCDDYLWDFQCYEWKATWFDE
jgi:hypothetical protein